MKPRLDLKPTPPAAFANPIPKNRPNQASRKNFLNRTLSPPPNHTQNR